MLKVIAAAIVVSAARERAPSEGAAESLWTGSSPALMVRTQSEVGSPTDLSIHGSSFSEAGLVFNGATVRHAQTEHFNADLPVTVDWLGEARVLTGLDLFRTGAGHPAGSFAVNLSPPTERGGKVTIGGGLHGLVFSRLNDIETYDVGETGMGWVGAFVDAAHADRIDGYHSNPIDRTQAGGRFGFGAENWTFDSLVSTSWRDFGCTGAYGANEKYPAWEKDRTSLATATWHYDADDDQPSEISVLWSRGHDIYWLDRENHDFYCNRHLTDDVTLHATTRRHFTETLFIDLRSDADAELYEKNRDDFRRYHGSLAMLPGVKWGAWEAAAGAAGEFYSDYAGTCAPAGGLSYAFDETAQLALSYREGCRQPSFTELTYESPDSRGRLNLPLQRTRTLNLDATWEKLRGGLFLMRSEDLVDWLKTRPGASWQATALKSVTAFGCTGEAEWAAAQDLTVTPRAAFTFKQTQTDYWASRYAMDFPIGAASVEATYRILAGWRVTTRQGLEVWQTNPVRRGSRVRDIAQIETTYVPTGWDDLELTVGVDDMFNQAFEVYPGQKALGFTMYVAVTYRW